MLERIKQYSEQYKCEEFFKEISIENKFEDEREFHGEISIILVFY